MSVKYKILIVDDDHMILKLMENVFSRDRFIIRTFDTAEDINEKVKKFNPHIILLDVKLKGVSGMEIIKTIKDRKNIKHIPVIAFTSYAMKGDKDKFLAMGYDGYISKPFDTRKIIDQVLTFIQNIS